MNTSPGMTFGEAVQVMSKGHRVARAGWNGKGMFIYLVKGQEIPYDSLRGEAATALSTTPRNYKNTVRINPHIDMYAADGSIVVGWLASQTDMLATDWLIVE